MNNDNIRNNVADDTIDLELEALLEDATTANDETAVEAVADPEAIETALEADLEDIDAAAHVEAMKDEAYAEQEADEDEGITIPAAASAANDDETATVATPKVPRASRAAGAKASDVLKSVMSEEDVLKVACLSEGDAEDESLVDALNSTINGLAKKVGSKAVNLLRFKGNPAKLEGYTRKGLDFLIAKGEASSTDLTNHLQSLGYTVGTARSQANQLMQLFPSLKVASKNGRTLSLRDDSNLVKAYQAATA